MRVLLTSQPLLGHFRPLVPLAESLRARGHDVLVATAPFFVPTVGTYGFDASAIGTDEPLALDTVLARVGTDTSDQAERAEVFVLADHTARAALADVTRLVDEQRISVLVRDSAEFAGYLAAERVGIPHATVDSCLATSIYSRRGLFWPALAELRALCGLDAEPTGESLFRYLHLEFMPPEFFTEPGEVPPTTDFFRQTNVTGPRDVVPPWVPTLPDAPTVLLNLGTLTRQPGLLMRIHRALRGQPINLIVKFDEADEGLYERLRRQGIHAAANLSPTALLPWCDLFITHAGFNGVKESIRLRVPMVLIPQFGDQPFIAERCRALGLGQILNPDATPSQICDRVLGALDDTSLRSNVSAMADAMNALPTIDAAAATIEKLVESSRYA